MRGPGRVAIHTTLLATAGLVVYTRYQDRTALYRFTREDGPVEWLTVSALLTLCLVLFARLRKPGSRYPTKIRLAGYSLGLLALLAAGEEISWGQRIFGFQTGDTMKKINYQQETNLHNLIPGELFNGLIIFAVGIAMVALPLGWRTWKSSEPWWLPSRELSLLTLAVICVNHYRVTSFPEKLGLVVLGLILLSETVRAILKRNALELAACSIGWVTGSVLYHCRLILPVANQQYEIRELLVIMVALCYCTEVLDKYAVAEDVQEPPAET